MSKFLDKSIVVIFFVLIGFSTLAHGAVEAWSLALVETGIVAMFLLWAIKVSCQPQENLRIPSIVWSLCGFIILGIFQSLAWTDSNGRRASLSLDVESTREVVVWLVLLAVTLILVANLWAHNERLTLLRSFLIYFGLTLAVFALIQKATWNGHFYWLRKVNTEIITAPFGPFVHHGHYAGYLELLLPFPLAFLLTHKMRVAKKLLYGFAATMMGVSIFASLARGGIVSLIVEIVFLSLMSYWLTQMQQRRGNQPDAISISNFTRLSTILVFVVILLIGIVWIGIEPVLNRVAQGQENGVIQALSADRGWVWRDTLTMFRAHPVTGVGIGAFEIAFPAYTQHNGSINVNAAHNDYLQILAETGIIGGLLMVWFLVVLFRSLFRALQAQDTRKQSFALASGAGIIGILAHSFFDFNLQLPSHALLFTALVAVVSTLSAQYAEQSASGSVHNVQPQTKYFDIPERLPEQGLS